nr:1-acyl-sn-glycerol-3-phosphate acyltransferase [Parachlamydiaceae bacterium]
LHLTDIQGGYLFLLTAIGIGSGSIIAGRVSGKTVELGLVPMAGLGVIISCYMLEIFSTQLYAVIPLVVLLGFFGGMYQIPLDTFIQVTSPNTSRGQIVATTNFLSFFGVLCASGLLYLISEIFQLDAAKGFGVMGSLMMVVTTVITFQYFDYLSRFICMILSKLHFQTTIVGLENIPNTPAIYFCTHTAWNDTLLMLGTQRQRMRFFIQQEQNHTHTWIKRLYRMLRVVMIPTIEPLENNKLCLAVIKNTLKKGISVCIFIEKGDLHTEIEKFNDAFSFREVHAETDYPIIPVTIKKSEKHQRSGFYTRILNKFRVPAAISFSQLNT